jgi:hypothetical protein
MSKRLDNKSRRKENRRKFRKQQETMRKQLSEQIDAVIAKYDINKLVKPRINKPIRPKKEI